MSFTREDYAFCVKVARHMYALDAGDNTDSMAERLFSMCENVIGQQSPPLLEQEGQER